MVDNVGSPLRPTSQQQQHAQQQPQGLPSISTLTNGLPPPSHQRSPEHISATDSARDSGSSWPLSQSKHNSANSGLHVHTLLNRDDSPPHRTSQPATPLSSRMPNSALSGHQVLPSIDQGFQEPGNRDSQASFDSRRSSVDSRMQLGFNGLYINNPHSPYESTNTSQVSLAASLRRPNGQGPLSPLSGRSGVRSHPAPPRIAPPIMPVGRTPGQPDPTAAKPTQGYAWAFPDAPIPEERRGSESGDSSTHGISRTNSFAASSIRSSIFSTDSHLPVGQRRFEEDGTTHHHTMQHRTIQSLQNENLSSSAMGNYSRTPELRVSHKLAERKRRSEMKDLFEELNKAVPSNAGAKASKWEILTKAIEHIKTTNHSERQLHAEVQRLQRECDYARDAHKENELLKTEVQVMHQTLKRLDPNAPHVYGHFSSQLSQMQANGAGGGGTAGPGASAGGGSMQLPPLNPPGSSAGRLESSGFAGGGGGSGGGPPQSSGSAGAAMQGVEYGYGQAR